MDLWLACLVLTHLHLHQHRQHHLLQQQIFELWCVFFGGLPFALLVLQCRAAFSFLLFSKYVVRVALLFGPLAPLSGCLGCCSLEWQLDSPLALSLRFLATAELCSIEPASPAWSSREPSDLSGLDQGDPLGFLLDVPWAFIRNRWIPDYSRDTIIAIMELDWLCTGVKSKPSVLYEGLFWITKLGKQKGPR